MPESKTCPKCGDELPANAPSGICPKCLMGAGLDSVDESKAADNEFEKTTPQTGGFVPPSPAALAPHFPHLEIGELLGHGGMGAVYKARQTKLDRLVALKIIRPEAADDPSFAERFHREARTLARLSHPNVVAVHDFGEVTLSKTEGDDSATRTVYYFLMEHVDGSSLRQLLEGRDLTAEQALAIVPQICEALQFAHDENIVHRDIKPENILVDRRGRVKIADFGLAKLVSDHIADARLTGTCQVMGTPRYMAPEQMAGSHDVDHRADIYSLGVVFYEMLTGEVPLGHFDPPSQRVGVDARLDEVVLRSLARDPDRRHQRASEVKGDVEVISSGGSIETATHARVEMRDVRQPAKESDDSSEEPRSSFSVGAIIGALIFPVTLIAALSFAIVIWRDHVQPVARLTGRINVAPLLFPSFFVVLAGIATTIIGLVSMNVIRNSKGRINGLGLAFADAMVFPLLVLYATTLGVVLGFSGFLGATPGSDLNDFVASCRNAAVLSTVIGAGICWSIWKKVKQSFEVRGESGPYHDKFGK